MSTIAPEAPAETPRSFEFLELFSAILLGFAAIATAFASFQSALYDGKSSEGYGRANKLATAAAAERSRAIVEMSKDNTIDVEAMRLVLEADDSNDATLQARNYEIATYLYVRQLSDSGYKALGLPAEARKAYEAIDQSDATATKQEALQEQMLLKAMEKDLVGDETYRKDMLAKSEALFDESEKTFKAGQEANEIGDKFQLVAVVYAIGLFFGGIVQVFRSDKMRLVIIALGCILVIAGTIYLFTIPWTFS